MQKPRVDWFEEAGGGLLWNFGYVLVHCCSHLQFDRYSTHAIAGHGGHLVDLSDAAVVVLYPRSMGRSYSGRRHNLEKLFFCLRCRSFSFSWST